MKVVRCLVDFTDARHGRTKAFNKLCLVLMLLDVWDVTRLIDTDSGIIKTWAIDRKHQQAKVDEWKAMNGQQTK